MPDPFGAVSDLLSGGVKDMAGGVVNMFSQWLWSGGLDILKVGVGLADKFGTVNLDVHSGPMAAVWAVTLPVGLATLSSRAVTDFPAVFAGMTIAALPMIVLFFLGQKYFIRGLADGIGK